jgi:hypothetical protein
LPSTEKEIEAVKLSFGKNRTLILRRGQIIIRLPYVPKSPDDLGILAHEIFHATEFIMKKIGVNLTLKTDEIYAYTIQYLTKEVCKELPIFCRCQS